MDAITNPTIGQAGLAIDIFGAALLAWGFFRQSDVSIERAARPMISEIADVESLVLARSDAKAGLALLTIGFILQGVGSLHPYPEVLAWLPAVGGPLFALVYLAIRKRWVRAKVDAIRKPEEQAEVEKKLDQVLEYLRG